MVRGKRLLCRKCAVTYPSKVPTQQLTFPHGEPIVHIVKLKRCPKCNAVLEELGGKK